MIEICIAIPDAQTAMNALNSSRSLYTSREAKKELGTPFFSGMCAVQMKTASDKANSWEMNVPSF